MKTGDNVLLRVLVLEHIWLTKEEEPCHERAARRLGMHRTTLTIQYARARRLRQLGRLVLAGPPHPQAKRLGRAHRVLKAGDAVTVLELEVEHILRIMEQEGTYVGAARRLGIGRATVSKRVREQQIDYVRYAKPPRNRPGQRGTKRRRFHLCLVEDEWTEEG